MARHTPEPDEDVVMELSQHAAAAFAAARAEGQSDGDASAALDAMIETWCRDAVVHARRRPRRTSAVPPPAAGGARGLWQDVRYGVRLLRRQPGISGLAILTAALGIGATTTLASVAYGVLARPLPFPHADRLVRVIETRNDTTRLLPPILTNGPYVAWRDTPTTIDHLAAFAAQTVTVDGGQDPLRVRGLAATASLFRVLDARPAHGTFFSEADEAPGRAGVVVLSDGLWRERFGGRPDAVGQIISLDGKPHTIVGVAAPDFAFPDREHRFWVPFHVPPVVTTNGNTSISLFGSIARLAPGATTAQASAEATSRAGALPALGMVGVAVFGTRSAPVVNVVPLVDFMTGEVRPALLVLLAGVALLFATAVGNLSSMQLARVTARRRELAIRAAMGASRGRLARQLLIEGAIIGLAGGLAGLALAAGLHAALPTLLPADFPRLTDVHLDLRLIGAALGIALVAGVGVGVFPALHAQRVGLTEVLVEEGQAPVGIGFRSPSAIARSAIVAAQVAAAALLLVGAGLFGRSFVARWHIDRGYEPANLLTARLPMPDHAFTGATRAAALADLLTRLESLPGVVQAGFSTVLPLSPYDALMGFRLPPRDGAGEPVDAQASGRTVSPGYFQALGVRLASGRLLSDADTRSSKPVVVVNRSFVRAYLSGDGVGARLPLGMDDGAAEWEVVGVIEDVQPRVGGEPPRPEIFVSYRQRAGGLEFDEPIAVVRTADDPAPVAASLRAIARQVHPAMAVESILTMEDRLSAGLAQPRLYAVLIGAFAALAVTIAAVGLFGVLSHTVARRTREIGVRAALGATPGRIVGLVLRQSLGISVIGLVTGLAGAALATPAISSLLYGVRALDPPTFAVVGIGVAVVAAVAAFVPARRAARIDPLTALKS